MIKKKLFLTLMAFMLSLATAVAKRGFAIIVDNDTYSACKVSIESYRELLQSEGFSAVVVSQNWESPQQIRDTLYHLYLNNNLEGTLLLGNIPIAMIRDAQHLTSAFKMDQERYPFVTSSVPSDRFYDDFDLKFDYLGEESDNSIFHYYSLRYDSAQYIDSDIYSGRIKPTKSGEEGYLQIREYFAKLIAERKKENRLDVITSYTGEGSYSNSLTAWREEGHLMREQFGYAFKDKNSVKSLFFAMKPYMKEIVIEELKRDEMDLMLFHQHGMPERMYLSAIPHSKGVEQYNRAAKRVFRTMLSRKKSEEEIMKAKEEWGAYYNIDSTWFSTSHNKESIAKDSIDYLRTGITVEEVISIAPNARVVIFDACYNGDFRENQFIAGEFVFGGGKSLISFANSVNVLQDKSSNDLLGMLGMGFSVGQWAREVNILESHIIGDPTFRFYGERASTVNLNSKEVEYWRKLYDNEEHPDLKGLALRKLFKLNYSDMARLLTSAYFDSPWYSLRLQVYHLLQHYSGEHFGNLLEYSAYDPYEFIRRKSIYSMGRIGYDSYIPHLVSIYFNEYLDERVHFNVVNTFDLMDTDKLESEAREHLNANSSFPDKEEAWGQFKMRLESRKRIASMAETILDPNKKLASRISAARMLRNNAYHNSVDLYLEIVANPNEEESLRITLAEALGWFTLSKNRDSIIKSFKEVAAQPQTPVKLRYELIKSITRIEVYMR